MSQAEFVTWNRYYLIKQQREELEVAKAKNRGRW